MAFAGFSPGEAEGLRRAMSRKRSEAAIEAYHRALRRGRGRARTAPTTRARRAGLRDDRRASRASASRRPTAPRSGCSPTSRRGCACTTARSSSARCSTSSRWASTRPTRSSTRPSGAGSRCSRPTSTRARSSCTVERRRRVRIGLGYVRGVRAEEVAALVAAREAGGPFRSLGDLAARAGAGRPALELLAWSGACDALAASGDRRVALWQLGVAAPGAPVPRRHAARAAARAARRAGAARARAVGGDARRLRHDRADRSARIRSALLRRGCPAGTVASGDLETLRHGARVRVGGLVVARQRPGTANGIVFLLIEDEHGTVNLIVPPQVYERHRLPVRTEPLMLAEGRLERCRGRRRRSTCSSTGSQPLEGAPSARPTSRTSRSRAERAAAGEAGRRPEPRRLPAVAPAGDELRVRAAAMRPRASTGRRGRSPRRMAALLFIARLRRARPRVLSSSRCAAARAARASAWRRRAAAPAGSRSSPSWSRCVASASPSRPLVLATATTARDDIPEALSEAHPGEEPAASCSASTAPSATRWRPPTPSARSGPNLDELRPPKALVLDAIEKGRERGNGHDARRARRGARTPRTSRPSSPRPSASRPVSRRQ